MGVPVLTLVDRSHAGRVGLSLLSAVDLPEFIVSDSAGYIARAAALAGDRDRLMQRRADLRERVRMSPLCDAPAFTRNLETAFRGMWRRWCGRDGGSLPKTE